MWRAWCWIVFAAAGCSGSGSSTPNGTYAVTTTSCGHFHAKSITFDGVDITVAVPSGGFDGRTVPATNVKIAGGHAAFDLIYGVWVGDTDTIEDCDESYALDVTDTEIIGSGTGMYSGTFSGHPFGCSGSFTVDGARPDAGM